MPVAVSPDQNLESWEYLSSNSPLGKLLFLNHNHILPSYPYSVLYSGRGRETQWCRRCSNKVTLIVVYKPSKFPMFVLRPSNFYGKLWADRPSTLFPSNLDPHSRQLQLSRIYRPSNSSFYLIAYTFYTGMMTIRRHCSKEKTKSWREKWTLYCLILKLNNER